jgi:hypothetical protein
VNRVLGVKQNYDRKCYNGAEFATLKIKGQKLFTAVIYNHKLIYNLSCCFFLHLRDIYEALTLETLKPVAPSNTHYLLQLYLGYRKLCENCGQCYEQFRGVVYEKLACLSLAGISH